MSQLEEPRLLPVKLPQPHYSACQTNMIPCVQTIMKTSSRKGKNKRKEKKKRKDERKKGKETKGEVFKSDPNQVCCYYIMYCTDVSSNTNKRYPPLL